MRIAGPIPQLLRRYLPRAFWAVLVGIHAPLLVRTVVSIGEGDFAASRWAALAILLPATILFALKLADASWLRWQGRPGAWIVFLLICAIAHHEAVSRATEGPLTWQAVALVTTVGVIRTVRRSADRWDERLRRLLAALLPAQLAQPACQLAALCSDLPPPLEPYLRSARPPRAPPG